MKFHLRIPMDAHRQLVRHRTASINEYSTRYSEAIDECQQTQEYEWRGQSQSNKQGSEGGVEWPEHAECDEYYIPRLDHHHGNAGSYLSEVELELQKKARAVYEERLNFGVAREQARKDLPLSTYTELYWKIDVRNLLGFLYLRCDEHAQLEIRSYANVMAAIVREVFPLTFEAFHDYRMDVVTFTRAEWKALKEITEMWEGIPDGDSDHGPYLQHYGITNKREQQEFHKKLNQFNNPPKTFNIADFEQLDMN